MKLRACRRPPRSGGGGAYADIPSLVTKITFKTVGAAEAIHDKFSFHEALPETAKEVGVSGA